jgi:radical SAM protein with 4Fe4S-binding SPASM domain
MMTTNEVRIETSTFCNHSCLFCPYSTLFVRKKQIMSLELFKFLLNKIKKQEPNITELTISGFGEPFMDSTIIEKIRYAHKLGYFIHILTNGTLLNKNQLDFLLSLSSLDIRISLHALDPLVWKTITRGCDHYNLLYCINYIISNKTDRTKLTITVDVVDDNKKDIVNIINKYSKTVDLLEIWKPHNWVNTFSYRNGKPVRSTCGRPLNGPLQIQVDGTVNMCGFDFNGQLLLGDLKTQSINEIFNSNIYLELKDSHLNNTLNSSNYICKHCDQRKLQKGIVIYNSKFSENDRIGRISTTMKKVIL